MAYVVTGLLPIGSSSAEGSFDPTTGVLPVLLVSVFALFLGGFLLIVSGLNRVWNKIRRFRREAGLPDPDKRGSLGRPPYVWLLSPWRVFSLTYHTQEAVNEIWRVAGSDPPSRD